MIQSEIPSLLLIVLFISITSFAGNPRSGTEYADELTHLTQHLEECRNKVKSEGSADIKQGNEYNSVKPLFEVLTLPADIQNDFYTRQLGPHVLTDPNYYYWGMSVIRDSEGLYHGYASRWPIASGF